MSALIKSKRKGFDKIPTIVIQNHKQFEGVEYSTKELYSVLKEMPFPEFTVEYHTEDGLWNMIHIRDYRIEFYNDKQKRLPFKAECLMSDVVIKFDTLTQMGLFSSNVDDINELLCFLATIIETTMSINVEVVNIDAPTTPRVSKPGTKTPTKESDVRIIRLKNRRVIKRKSNGDGTGKSPTPHPRRAHYRRLFNKYGRCIGKTFIPATFVGNPEEAKNVAYAL